MSTLIEGNRESRDSLLFGDSTNHWHQFGLDNSPFDDALAVYYPVRQWEEHLSFLHQFRTASYPLLLIPGILGSGKTTLIKRFIESENDPVHIHYIEAQSHHTLSQFIQALSSASVSGIETQHDADIPKLIHQLNDLIHQTGPQLLLIDNAHRLNRETLMRLLHLLFTQDLMQSQFRVVLSGETQIQETVMNLLDAFASSRQVPSLELEPLSVQEVREYLEFRFDQAGMNQNLPFTPAVLKQIHLLSGGYPGRVNRVAQQIFVDTLKSEHEEPQPSKNTVHQLLDEHKTKLMGVGLVFALLVVAVQFHSKQNNSPATVAAQSTATLATTAPVKQSRSARSTETVTSPKSELSQDVREALAAAVDRIQAKEMAESEQYEDSFRMPVVHNQHLLAGAVMADSKVMLAKSEKKKPAELAQSVPAATVPEASKSLSVSADAVTGAELQMMASTGFTIQIMGVREPQLLEAFVAENHLTDVSYYRSKLNNQDWYILVYGNFQTQEEAKIALGKLPDAVKKQQPWVRSFDAVRQAIELAHQKEMPKDGARVAVR